MKKKLLFCGLAALLSEPAAGREPDERAARAARSAAVDWRHQRSGRLARMAVFLSMRFERVP